MILRWGEPIGKEKEFIWKKHLNFHVWWARKTFFEFLNLSTREIIKQLCILAATVAIFKPFLILAFHPNPCSTIPGQQQPILFKSKDSRRSSTTPTTIAVLFIGNPTSRLWWQFFLSFSNWAQLWQRWGTFPPISSTTTATHSTTTVFWSIGCAGAIDQRNSVAEFE